MELTYGYELELVISVEEDILIKLTNLETGEIREIKRNTFESAMRTLGREFDKDYLSTRWEMPTE